MGIFGDLFDFDGDGHLDPSEEFMDFMFFNEIVNGSTDDDEDSDNDDDDGI